MIGFDPLSLSAAYILASMSGAAGCPAAGPVETNMQVVIKDARINRKLSRADILAYFGDKPSSSMYYHRHWMTGGATDVSGKALKEGIDVEFTAHDAAGGKTCIAPSRVNYTVTYAPTTYIAWDLSDCVKKATLAHEKRHVERDTEVVNAYVPILEEAIAKAAAGIGARGPLRADEIDAAEDKVSKDILESIVGKWGNLSYTVIDKRADLDTAAYYDSDTAACPGEFPSFDPTRGR